jgi:hypothetical protein
MRSRRSTVGFARRIVPALQRRWWISTGCIEAGRPTVRSARRADQQWFIEELTQALAVAADTKDVGPLQEVLEAWTATVRLQQHPGHEAMIKRMQRRERGQPVELDELRALAARAVRWRIEQAEGSAKRSSATATPSE